MIKQLLAGVAAMGTLSGLASTLAGRPEPVVRKRLTAGGRWIRSYGALRLPQKPKDSAILGVAIRRFCPRFCPRVATRVYPGSDSRQHTLAERL
jgi:hypothetical protein